MRLPWTKKSEVTFDSDLLRLIATELHYANMQTTARDMFGKPLHELDNSQLKSMGRWFLAAERDIFNIITPLSLSSRYGWQHNADDVMSFFWPAPFRKF